MSAAGTFAVNLQAQSDDNAPAGRMIMDKDYSGDMVGKGRGQMISKRTEGGAAVYSAIEEFEGTVNGKPVLLHYSISAICPAPNNPWRLILCRVLAAVNFNQFKAAFP